MNRRWTLLPLLFLLLLTSCTEELDDSVPGFTKILGMESSSTGKRIIERPNGDLMILGQTSVSAFDFSTANESLEVGDVIEGGLSITITDPSGNQKALRSFPISELDTDPVFSKIDISGKGNLLDLVENSDGTFYALGQWRNFPVTIGSPWNLDFEDDSPIAAPFLLHLSADLNLLNIRSFNSDPGWDYTYYSGSRMKKLNNGNILVLLDNGFEPGSTSPSSYRLITIDEAWNTLSDRKYSSAGGVKLARDFDIDPDGNVVLIGQLFGDIVIYKIPLENMGSELTFVVDDDGVFGSYNNNMHFIKALDEGGYLLVYTNPTSSVVVNHLNSSFISEGKFELAPENEDEYPRAFARAENGDFLIYTEHLAQDVTSRGFLYRVNKYGERIFRTFVDGSPGDVTECSDGSLLVISNPVYNGLLPKATLTKISANGKSIY